MFKSGRMTNFAFMLEKYLIKPNDWEKCGMPDELLKVVKEESNNGYPTGVAHHPKYGWFGLGSGQGPYVWWCEMGPDELEDLIDDYYFGRLGG